MANTFRPSGISINIRQDLVEGASRSGTTLVIDPIITKDGHRVEMTDIGDICYAKLDQGTDNEEIISFTGITDNTTTYTLTGCIWGYNFYNGTGSVTANQKKHVAGGTFIITNDDHFLNEQYLNKDDFDAKSNNLEWGDGAASTDKKLVADNGDTDKPFMAYDESENVWVYSNDGISTSTVSSGATTNTGGDGIDITASEVSVDLATSSKIENDRGTGDQLDLSEDIDAALDGTDGFTPNSTYPFVTNPMVNSHVANTAGYLTCGTPSSVAVDDWDEIEDGSFRVLVNGTGFNVDALDIKTATPGDMDAVATYIQTQLQTATSDLTTFVWSTDHFVITSPDADEDSSISITTSTGTVGTDISGLATPTWMNGSAGVSTQGTSQHNNLVKLDADGKIDNTLTYSQFGGDGSDGVLNVTTGTTTLDADGANVLVKNYSSINIESGADVKITNEASDGTILILKCSGSCDIAGDINLTGAGASAGTNGFSILESDTHYGGAGSDAISSDATIAGVAGSIFSAETDRLYVTKEDTLFRKLLQVACGSGGGAGGDGYQETETYGAGGAGGAGGGCLLLQVAGTFDLSGNIYVNGEDGYDGTDGYGATTITGGGGGGGGAAGMLVVLYNELSAITGDFSAKGGAGGDGGANGGAGGSNTVGGAGGAGGGAFQAGKIGRAGSNTDGIAGVASTGGEGAGGGSGAGGLNITRPGGTGGVSITQDLKHKTNSINYYF